MRGHQSRGRISCSEPGMATFGADEWLLFGHKDGVPFKTKSAAEKARGKYPPKLRGGIGVGVSQIPVTRAKRKPKQRSS
jgi:hypothetical protein